MLLKLCYIEYVLIRLILKLYKQDRKKNIQNQLKQIMIIIYLNCNLENL